VKRILIIAPNWIGDAVLSQPLLKAIQKTYPTSSIDVLASPWVAPIYRACKETDRVIEVDLVHGSLQWQVRKQIAKQIRTSSYDAAFVLPNSLKSALIPWLAKIPIRIGYLGEMRLGLINRILPNPKKSQRMPMVERYLSLSRKLGISASSEEESNQPKLQVQLNQLSSLEKKLQLQSIHPNQLILFAPGAEFGPAKRWPADHFRALANLILNNHSQAHIILIGSKNDIEISASICENVEEKNRIHNWCGKTTLEEVIALIKISRELVSNDSGLMHIGAALHVDQIALFGSSDPKHTPPLSKKARIIYLGLECSPCHQRICPLGHLNCLRKITSERVYAMMKPD